MTRVRYRAADTARMKRLHGKRRREGTCIGNKEHGDAYKGGRCKPCWEKKLAAERAATAKRRAAAAEAEGAP